MPVIAIGAAIFADVVAGSAIAATVGGIMEISLVTALEVVTAVGATIGAIGAITKDKTLSMIGMGIGAIGGIGALATSAGVFGAEAASGASLFGSTSTDAAASGAAVDSQLSGAAADAASGAAGTTAAVPEGVALSAEDAASLGQNVALSQTGPTNDIGFINSGVGTSGGGLTSSTPNLTGSATDTNGLMWGSTATPTTTASGLPPGLLTDQSQSIGGLTTGAAAADTSAADTSSTGLSGMLGKIVDYVGNHEKLAAGIIQAGGSLIQGMTSTLTPAQVAALNAQAAANDAAAALTKQQTANLAAPKSVASSTPVTGTPAPIIQQASAGMINSAPKVAVTGAPA
jgi:hypothetical protein